MLKGNTKIELTDIHTGTTEVIEDENMFTNGLKYVVNALNQFKDPLQNVQNNTSLSCLFPIVENLLGGIMLFSSPLEEDVENIYPPTKANKMIGCANMSMNDVPALTERGSFNSNESGTNADGSYTFVWDFNTTQANGTISSLALVPDCAGINGINLKNINTSHGLQLERIGKNVSTKGFNSQTSINSLMYAVTTTSEKWKCCLEKQQKENEETVSISLGGPSWNQYFYTNQVLKDVDYDMGKIHCAHIENVDGNYVLFDYDIDFSTTSIGLYEYRYEMTGISNVRSKILTSANQGFFGSCKPFGTNSTIKVLKIDSNNYVVMGVTSSVSPQNTDTGQSGSSTHSVMCVNMSDKTITQQFTKTYPCYLENISDMNVSYLPSESKIMFVCQKQSCIETSWRTEYYLAFVDINDFNSISYAYGLGNYVLIGSNNTKALYEGYYVNPFPGNGYLLKMDDEITVEPIISRGPLSEHLSNGSFNLAYLRDKVIVGAFEHGNSYTYPYIRLRETMLGTILMTINNLETSVEKTADKTMKITYTVREVEE